MICDLAICGADILYKVNARFSIFEQVMARAEALGQSLNHAIRGYLRKLAGADDAESSIDEFKCLSGCGHSRGWRFSRDEIHERR